MADDLFKNPLSLFDIKGKSAIVTGASGAFGKLSAKVLAGAGANVTTPDELKRAVDAALDSGKPTLINAVIDPAAGSESGRIGNLNPQSALKKK